MATAYGSWDVLVEPFERHRAQNYAQICQGVSLDPVWAGCPAPLAALHAVRLASFHDRATDPFGGDALAFLSDLEALSDEVMAAVSRGLVQFTEPLRIADVLPGLLLAAHWAGPRPLRVVELGSSVGVLLAPEHFRIRYPRASWEPPTAAAELVSDLDVPPALLMQPLTIVDRVGVDLAPVDPRDPGAYDHLRAFAWPGDPAREQRLADAVRTLAIDPPRIERADAIAALPDLVHRDPGVVTVVIESAMAGYLAGPRVLRLGRTLDHLSARTPLMLLTRGPQPRQTVLTSRMTLVDLTNRRRLTYALADMLSERTRWVVGAASEPGE